MAAISKQLEHKEYTPISHTRDAHERAFLRGREADLLFRNGLDYDASRDLERSQAQVNKALKEVQRQIDRDREHTKQMDLGL